MVAYADYKEHVVSDIEGCLEELGCQPIVFAGSGLSQRYMSAPTWKGLLKYVNNVCPALDKSFAYYEQKFGDLIDIASFFVDPVKEWAWANVDNFPEEYFEGGFGSEIYIKYLVSSYLKSLMPSLDDLMSSAYSEEIKNLQAISPHSIITTNYDLLLELIFSEHKPIIGQKILRSEAFSLGEIFKIHGCLSEPESIILTRNDYNDFLRKKKYLSAKLLAFFAEHPLLLVGYSVSDPNIKAILSDIDEILSDQNGVIANIYILKWVNNVSEGDYPAKDELIELSDQRNVRVKCIVTDDFSWVFKAFSSRSPLEKIRPKLLRSLLARTYELVRTDIPNKRVEVNYDMLEHAVEGEGDFGKLLGITSVGDPSKVNLQFPYTLTQVASKLDYDNWYYANELLKRVQKEDGVNLKGSDNKYHISIKTGKNETHKYSELMVSLLQAVKGNQPYELKL